MYLVLCDSYNSIQNKGTITPIHFTRNMHYNYCAKVLKQFRVETKDKILKLEISVCVSDFFKPQKTNHLENQFKTEMSLSNMIRMEISIRLKWVKRYEPQHVISNTVVCATSKGSDQPAHTRSLIRAFARRLNTL